MVWACSSVPAFREYVFDACGSERGAAGGIGKPQPPSVAADHLKDVEPAHYFTGELVAALMHAAKQ
jgi:hypothetical protein